MRGFFWSKLPDRLAAESKWKDLPDTGINVNTKEIEAIFASKTKSSAAGGAKAAAAAKKTGPILLFDAKRQQNAGIALARLRMPTSEIVAKVRPAKAFRSPHRLLLLPFPRGPARIHVLVRRLPTTAIPRS